VSASAQVQRASTSRGLRGAAIALAAAVLVALVALVVVAARGPARPPTFQERVHTIAEGLRCPVCQNLSVADSPSGLAQQMRADIALRLHRGQSEGQIDAYFTSKFGRWILLTPQAGGIGLVAWLAPAVAVAGGAALAWTVVRRRRRLTTDPAAVEITLGDEPKLTAAERARVQAEIDALREDP
jgi:cytochrome c-type biogenesis protein CcmH